MARVLIIGADGTLGRAAAAYFSARGDAVVRSTRRSERPAKGRLLLDLEDPATLTATLPSCDVAIICAAMARYADCRAFHDRARLVNVIAPLALARRLAGTGCKIILLSTSAVFDGTTPRVSADAPVAPLSVYGRLKAEAEAGILDLGSIGSVLRLTKVIPHGMPLLMGWIERLRFGLSVRAFADLAVSPIAVEDVVTALGAVADDVDGGIYQVSGAGDISYLEIAAHLARAVGAPGDLIESVSAVARGIAPEEAPRFNSLDTTRLSQMIGFEPPEPIKVLNPLLN